jgi:predicted membrane channel-forming protein YqfA (hemolysin III family)
MIWCLSSIAYRMLCIYSDDKATSWQRFELAGALVLISATAIPFAMRHFSENTAFRVVYACCLAMTVVEKLASVLTIDLNDSKISHTFRYHCTCMGVIAMVPALHAMCDLSNGPTQQAVDLVRFAGLNSVAAALCHLVRIPERTGLVGSWRPSLYIMRLVLVLSSIWYSKKVLKLSV